MDTEKITEKKKENVFEFAIFVNDYKVVKDVFSADQYSPAIRKSVDIRHLSDDIINIIQEDFKKKDSDKSVEKKKIKENKFEFALFVNESKIITRYFSVEDYNSKFRYSLGIKYLVDDIVNMIRQDLYKKDINYQWNEYEYTQRTSKFIPAPSKQK